MKNKKFVVEGLADMAAQAERVEAKSIYDLRSIPLNEIAYHPQNLFGMRDIEKLADSMKEVGQLHNAVVRHYSDSENTTVKFQLISGERRHRAAGLLGWDALTCKVVDASDLEAERMLIVTNIETRELNDMEKARSVERLYQIIEQQRAEGVDFEGKKTREVVAGMLSGEGGKVAAATIGQLKKLNELIPEFAALVESGELPRETAYQYAQMDESVQKMVFEAFNVGKSTGVEMTAKEAKELKDELLKKDADHTVVIDKMREDIRKSKEEVRDFKVQADEATSKVKKLEVQNKVLEKSLQDTKTALSTAENEKKVELDKINAEKDEIRKQIEEAVRAETSEENENALKILNWRLDEATNNAKVLEDEYKTRIDGLIAQHDKKEEELRDKLIEKNNIEGNKAIQSLAKQAQKSLETLLEEFARCYKNEGFLVDEETRRIMGEITKSVTDVTSK